MSTNPTLSKRVIESLTARSEAQQWEELIANLLRRLVNRSGIVDMIDADHYIRVSAQIDQSLDFTTADNLVGNQNVVNAGCRHHFRLTKFGTGDTDRAGLQTHMRQGRGFHRFGMRSPGHTGVMDDYFRHALNILLQKIEIDQQCGGVKTLFGLSY